MDTRVSTHYIGPPDARRRAVRLTHVIDGATFGLRMCAKDAWLSFFFSAGMRPNWKYGQATRCALGPDSRIASAGIWTRLIPGFCGGWSTHTPIGHGRIPWFHPDLAAHLLSFARPLAHTRRPEPLLDFIAESLPDPWCWFSTDPVRMFRTLCPYPLAGGPNAEAPDESCSTHPSPEVGGSLCEEQHPVS